MIKDLETSNCIIPSTTVTITSGGSQCHGCSGRGWVETSDRQPHRCPVCNGAGLFTAPALPYVPSPFPYIPTYPLPYTPEPWRPAGPWYSEPYRLYVGDIPPGLEPFRTICGDTKTFFNGTEIKSDDIAHTFKC